MSSLMPMVQTGAQSVGGTVAVPVGGFVPANGGSMQIPGGVPGGTMQLPPGGPPRREDGSVDLTAGLPDPETVRKQKEQFALDLEEQLRQGVELLGAAHKQKTDLLHANANQEKHRYNLVLDQQVKQQELLLSQQYNEQLMRLQQAAQAQRAGLEKQACGLVLEYQQRKVHEEFMAQQMGIQKQHYEAQSRLQEEMQKLGAVIGGSSDSNSSAPTHVTAPSMAPSVQPPPGVDSRPVVAQVANYAAPPMLMAPAPVGGVLPYVPPAATRSSTPTPGYGHMTPMMGYVAGAAPGSFMPAGPRPQSFHSPAPGSRGMEMVRHNGSSVRVSSFHSHPGHAVGVPMVRSHSREPRSRTSVGTPFPTNGYPAVGAPAVFSYVPP